MRERCFPLWTNAIFLIVDYFLQRPRCIYEDPVSIAQTGWKARFEICLIGYSHVDHVGETT